LTKLFSSVAPWFKYKFISDYIENRKVVDWLSSLFIMLRIKFKLSRTKPICQDDKIPLETWVNIKCVHQKVFEWLSSLVLVLYFVSETRFSTITKQTKFWGLIVVFVLSKIWMSILSGTVKLIQRNYHFTWMQRSSHELFFLFHWFHSFFTNKLTDFLSIGAVGPFLLSMKRVDSQVNLVTFINVFKMTFTWWH